MEYHSREQLSHFVVVDSGSFSCERIVSRGLLNHEEPLQYH